MPDRNDLPLAESVDRYWDTLLSGTSAPPDAALPPDLAAAMQRVHALDTAPHPSSAFASTLWEHLMQTQAPIVSPPSSTRWTLFARSTIPAAPTRWPDQHRRSPLSRLAAAILLVGLLAGSAFAALYPLRSWNGQGLPLLAPPATTVTTPDIVSARLEHLWEFDGGSGDPGSLDRPYGMGVDGEGNLWVIDAGNDRIQIISPDGAHLETWGTSGSGDGQFEFSSRNSEFGLPYGDVDFDTDGNIYVVDAGNARVQKFGPDRAFIRAWGEEGQGDGQFVVPISIAVGPNDVVYVSDEQRDDIQMFDRDGNFLGAFGGPGSAPGQLSLASGLAFDSAGNLWVADWMNNRVQRFTAEGESLAVWGEQGFDEGELNGPSDIVVDDQGHVFVADDMNNRLQAFTADGTFLTSFGGFRSNVGTFANPIGLAIGEDGTVYVSDRRQVQAFRLTTTANPLIP